MNRLSKDEEEVWVGFYLLNLKFGYLKRFSRYNGHLLNGELESYKKMGTYAVQSVELIENTSYFLEKGYCTL